MPIRPSSSASPRPATGVPIAISSLPDSRASSTASAECTTMNRVAPCARASSASASWTTGSIRTSTRAPARFATGGRGRSLGNSSDIRQSGQLPLPIARSAGRQSNRAGIRHPVRHVATVRNRRTAPAAVTSRGTCPADPRRVGGHHITHQRRHRRAVGGDVVDHHREDIFVRRIRREIGDLQQPHPQRNLGGDIERCCRQTLRRHRRSHPTVSGSGRTPRTSVGGRITCTGPSAVSG